MVYELYYRRTERPEIDRTEPIALAATLTHPANANLKVQSRSLVSKINGKPITRLEDVIAALSRTDVKEHVIEFLPNNSIEVLSRAEAEKANDEILKSYGIPKDRRL